MNDSTNRFAGTAMAVPVSLPPNHPLFEVYVPVAKSLTPAAEATAAIMVEAAPGQGLDAGMNQEFFSSLPMDRMLNRANEYSLATAFPIVAGAHSLAMDQTGLLDGVESSLQLLENLEEQVIEVAGTCTTRKEAMALLDQAQTAATRAEARGDYEHLHSGNPGVMGWIVVVLISLLETLGVYAFMINLADFKSLTILVTLAGLLIIVNHLGTQWVGHALRDYRHKLQTRERAHTAGYALLHTQSPRAKETAS